MNNWRNARSLLYQHISILFNSAVVNFTGQRWLNELGAVGFNLQDNARVNPSTVLSMSSLSGKTSPVQIYYTTNGEDPRLDVSFAYAYDSVSRVPMYSKVGNNYYYPGRRYNSNLNDKSIHGYNFHNINSPSFLARVNQAFRGNQFSVSFWIKLTSTASNAAFNFRSNSSKGIDHGFLGHTPSGGTFFLIRQVVVILIREYSLVITLEIVGKTGTFLYSQKLQPERNKFIEMDH